MAGKRVWLGILGILCLWSAGCCSWCDRWCNRSQPAYHAPAGCVPCVPASAPPVCCPVPVGSSPAPAGGWQR